MLKGKLSDFGIVSIFEMLNQQEKSGILTINSICSGEVNIYFMTGNIIELSYKDKNKNLGVFLVKKQIIQKSILKKVHSKARKEIKSITTVLNEDGYISKDLEELIIDVYYDDALREVLSIKEGDFSFKPENKNEKQDYRIFYIDQILLEFVRQQDEIRVIKNFIPLSNAKISKLDANLSALNNEEQSLYELINQVDDLEKMRNKILIGYFDYINILVSLAKKKAITVTNYINEEERLELTASYVDDYNSSLLSDKINVFMLAISVSAFIVVTIMISFRGIVLFKKDVGFVKDIKVENKESKFFKENYSNIINADK